MSVRLHDPKRVRALSRAARRAARDGFWARWRRARTRWRARLRPSVFRLAIVGFAALFGALVARQGQAPSIHVFTLYGVALMQARISELRTLLYGDAALAALGQLPIDDGAILAFQLRQRVRPGLWRMLDAAAFWGAAWVQQEHAGAAWLWLPLIAIGFAFITEALALVLLLHWRLLGATLYGFAALSGWSVLSWEDSPRLWSVISSLLEVIGWLTPWGWLNALATRVHEAPIWGVPLIALVGVAAWLTTSRYAWLFASWVLHPGWREIAGVHYALQISQTAEVKPEEIATPESGEAAPEAATPASDPHADALAALQRARSLEPGHSLSSFGWAGRAALARWTREERALVDLLGPVGAGAAQWRWALLIAALTASGAVAGVSPFWPIAVLAVIVLLRRLPVAAVMLAAALGCALLWPQLLTIACVVGPCLIAMLMTMPLGGGTWTALPLSTHVLGSVPRSWSSLMKVMLTLTWLRLFAALPIVACTVLAVSLAVGRPLGAGIGAACLAMVLAMPSLTAMKLIQRTPGSLEVSVGRAWLTLPSAILLALQFFAGAMVTIGGAIATDLVSKGTVIGGAALMILIVTAAIQIALLRHAYRRTVDFVVASPRN